jgi:hypothetical protein
MPQKAFSQVDLFHEHGIYVLWVMEAPFQGKSGAKKAITTVRQIIDSYITFLYKK